MLVGMVGDAVQPLRHEREEDRAPAPHRAKQSDKLRARARTAAGADAIGSAARGGYSGSGARQEYEISKRKDHARKTRMRHAQP